MGFFLCELVINNLTSTHSPLVVKETKRESSLKNHGTFKTTPSSSTSQLHYRMLCLLISNTSHFGYKFIGYPFLSKTRALAKALADILSEFLKVFTDSLSERWGPFLRIRVKLDVTKPLRRGRNIKLQQIKDKFWVDFRYERLPEWCMECGCLGHPYQKCAIFMELMENGIEPELAYGPELKGAALPTSAYDQYRTNFSKGNAWPLLTRLERNTLNNTIPSLQLRNQPQPKKLMFGEASDIAENSQGQSSTTNAVQTATNPRIHQRNVHLDNKDHLFLHQQIRIMHHV
uniref:Zinc knuckle CX2CX4HX4C domain-containing protein n=1 Tax=Cannabis sativa TaxID=3483 RepID=A0A803PLR3_CANSA